MVAPPEDALEEEAACRVRRLQLNFELPDRKGAVDRQRSQVKRTSIYPAGYSMVEAVTDGHPGTNQPAETERAPRIKDPE
jgi:hypothetical protein